MRMSTKRTNTEPKYTAQDVARITGKSLQAVQRLAINHRLGVKKEGRRLFSDADVEIVRARSQPGWPRGKPRPSPAAAPAQEVGA